MQVYASLSILISDTKIVHLETPRKYINVPEANFKFQAQLIKRKLLAHFQTKGIQKYKRDACDLGSKIGFLV